VNYPTAEVIACHIWPADSKLPVPVEQLDLDFGGPIGDRHHGLTMKSDTRQSKHFPRGTEIRNHRQVSLVEATELQDVAASMGITEIEPGLIADNIYLRGAKDLTLLPKMTRLVFSSGAVIMLGGENDPCTIAGAMIGEIHGTTPQAFPKAAIHKRGVTGWVEHPGAIRPGDTVEIRT
jgi:hypothetical protein